MIEVTKIRKYLDKGDIIVPFKPKVYRNELEFIHEYFKKDNIYNYIPSTSNEYAGYNQFAVTIINSATNKITAQYEIYFKEVKECIL